MAQGTERTPSSQRLIRTVLVANRGEIARRVFRTARAMGMRCAAVYTTADRAAPFVAEADVAVELTGGSYLDGDSVLAAARRVGADAVHPGYGFLSENAGFARAVIDAGLVWVGPSPTVIEAMGDKMQAKRLAVKAGVPVLDSSEEATVDAAATIGYPVLVKAAAGGGGKGMRVVNHPEDFDEAVAAARREAESGFGDDRVFLERYVARSRHVEIQILGDSHGTVLHLGERECSIQRRHQKIIEEAPSLVVDQTMRDAMGRAAVDLALALDYTSTGTVEFLVDDETGDFHFLEVNTRLQVEHPVTEAVTGIDLVRQQLLVAAGRALDFTQDDVVLDGHAIEARLYAEDAANNFLPATGTVVAFEPAADPVVRWDSGVESGSVVGVEFDPMLAKVIAHGPTRSEAAGSLALALERLHLAGPVTNRDFLVAVLRSEPFIAGDTTTDFVPEFLQALEIQGLEIQGLEIQGLEIQGLEIQGLDVVTGAVVGAMWLRGRNRAADRVWGHLPSNWRNAVLAPEQVTLRPRGLDGELSVTYRATRSGAFSVTVAGAGTGADSEPTKRTVEVFVWSAEGIEVAVDGVRARHRVTADADRVHVQTARTTLSFDVQPRFPIPGTAAPTGGLVAPMPGVVNDVRCSVGDRVEPGQILMVLEAMKMEHHIKAPMAGMVTAVPVTAGGQVDNGALLITLDPDQAADPGDS